MDEPVGPVGEETAGEFLKRLREERSLSQEKAAALAGITSRTVRRAELGDRLQVRTVQRLARLYGVSSEEIFRRFPEEKPESEGDQHAVEDDANGPGSEVQA